MCEKKEAFYQSLDKIGEVLGITQDKAYEVAEAFKKFGEIDKKDPEQWITYAYYDCLQCDHKAKLEGKRKDYSQVFVCPKCSGAFVDRWYRQKHQVLAKLIPGIVFEEVKEVGEPEPIKEPLDNHTKIYLEEFELWLRSEEVRERSLRADLEAAEKSYNLSEQMLELQLKKIENAKKERDDYLNEISG